MKLFGKTMLLILIPLLHSWMVVLTMYLLSFNYEKALSSGGTFPDTHLIAVTALAKQFLVAGSVLTALLSCLLAFYFSRMLTKRIGRACEDLKKIQAGEELDPPDPELNDEFSLLDAEIRKTAVVVRGIQPSN